MLKWMRTWYTITNPVVYLLLFGVYLYLVICQMAYLPGTVRLEDGGIPLCLVDIPKHWADEADLVDDHSSEDDEWSEKDVPGTKFQPCCCFLLSEVTAKLAPCMNIPSVVLCECA